MVTAYEISTGKLKKGGFLPEKSENGRLKLLTDVQKLWTNTIKNGITGTYSCVSLRNR